MNVVLVEDEGITAMFLEETIESLGSKVVGIFAEGESLLVFLEHNSIDLIFMDIQINGALDGIQVATRVHQKYPAISFVFLTSFKDTDTIASAKIVKPLGYLIKPIIEADLEAMLMVVESVREIRKSIPDSSICLGEYNYTNPQ